ncbi:RidA family protein [Streptomyces sp. K1PA1]|uniref:RidA family protein n=1 Tax=Streptomyces tropicalis TaxID=3034234 RepID=A0ABT6A491_9ACTN|nr:RidA family protein [Streptomyces tropicalis]MDF3299440.1 RidA family protein [Streptomyces tropicalis]
MPFLDSITTDAAPQPLGHYSQPMVTPDGTIRVSAQLPLGGGVHPDSRVVEQARQALANVLAIVESTGASGNSIARITVYLSDISDWEVVDAVVGEVPGEHRPARTVLQVSGLHRGFRIAADAVAHRVLS